MKRHAIVHLADLDPLPCPCGTTRRAFLEEPGRAVSMHVVEIRADASLHHHERLTEVYYILEGDGEIELDGERHPVRPGDAILIRPGCVHRAVGRMKILNVVIPAFDPGDEILDGPVGQ